MPVLWLGGTSVCHSANWKLGSSALMRGSSPSNMSRRSSGLHRTSVSIGLTAPRSLQAAWRTRRLDWVPFMRRDPSNNRVEATRSREERTRSAVGEPYPASREASIDDASSKDFSRNAEILLSRPRGVARSVLSPNRMETSGPRGVVSVDGLGVAGEAERWYGGRRAYNWKLRMTLACVSSSNASTTTL